MKIFRWTAVLIYAGFIFYLSSQTWQKVPAFPFADKIAHVILYLGFSGVVLWALRTTKLRYHRLIGITAFAVTVLYGLTDEIHQLFVPGREFSLLDLTANAVGAVLGVLIASKAASIVRGEKGRL